MKTFEWDQLGFTYRKTDYNIRCYYRDGKWGELEISSSDQVSISMASTALLYGQEIFEGLKAYRGKDGKVRLFRWKDNAERLRTSAAGVKLPMVSDEMFLQAVSKAISLNEDYIPPYGTGATLYIRPMLFATGADIRVKPADEYLFIVFVVPVGPYFKDGFKPVNVQICRDFDRAAPLGTGSMKLAGNYAPGMRIEEKARGEGYATVLYLDAKEKKYIDECGPANFFGIKGSSYITPESASILPSITNRSLKTLAEDLGLNVECRKIEVSELENFDEAGACGTAAVISPIGRIDDPKDNHSYIFSKDGEPGPVSKRLYERLTAIQFGEEEDTFGWMEIVE